MKRFRPQQSTSGLFRRGSKAAVSEMSRSMMDLSMHNTDTNHGDRGNPVPRFRASVSICFVFSCTCACEEGVMEEEILLQNKLTAHRDVALQFTEVEALKSFIQLKVVCHNKIIPQENIFTHLPLLVSSHADCLCLSSTSASTPKQWR